MQKPELQKKTATGGTAWKQDKETTITKLQGTRYH
jgi:hypothetical protein